MSLSVPESRPVYLEVGGFEVGPHLVTYSQTSQGLSTEVP